MTFLLFLAWAVALWCIRERRTFYAFMLASALVMGWEQWDQLSLLIKVVDIGLVLGSATELVRSRSRG